ncbi:hypothetical protein QYF36_008263 [Acer negundo]|nr:hypothetical protein QYF36_008263 [Acer negundo]
MIRFRSILSAGHNTASNIYTFNLTRLFSRKLYDQGGNSVYYNTTDGTEPDKVYGLFLCRGDVTKQTCQSCINSAIDFLVTKCQGTMSAITCSVTLYTLGQCIPGLSKKDCLDSDAQLVKYEKKVLGLFGCFVLALFCGFGLFFWVLALLLCQSSASLAGLLPLSRFFVFVWVVCVPCGSFVCLALAL